MTKDDLITYLVDVLGYCLADIETFERIELAGMLTDVQMHEAMKYVGVA